MTDAALLAIQSGCVLLVISAGKTKRDHAKKAKALLEKVNAHLIGTVLTNVKGEAGLYQYYSNEDKST